MIESVIAGIEKACEACHEMLEASETFFAKKNTLPELESLDNPVSEMLNNNINNTIDELPSSEKLDTPVSQELSNDKKVHEIRMPKENSIIGAFDGERGNSNFVPNDNYIPSKRKGQTLTNPSGKSLKEIFDDNKIENIPFRDNYPDFSKVSKGTVEINMTEKRYNTDGNFTQADEKLAQEKGCTPRQVREWRKENNYTWHECEDKKTMQKVPNTIHGNIPHDGGISIIKREKEQNNG